MDRIFKIIKAFIEGEIDINAFHDVCMNDNELRKFVDFQKPYSDKYTSFHDLIENTCWDKVKDKYDIYLAFRMLLSDYGIQVKPTNSYVEAFQKLYSVIPSWLSDEASDYVEEEIIDKAPKGLTKTETKAWIKAKIKETFKYEKRPPQWVQEGNWPRDEEGNFLTFRSQKEDGDLVTYIFVNPKTGEEVQTQEFF